MQITCPECHKKFEVTSTAETTCPRCGKKVALTAAQKAEIETEELFVIDEIDDDLDIF